MSSVDHLAQRAGQFWRDGNFIEATRCYDELLSLELSPLMRAKSLANLMQVAEKAGDGQRTFQCAEEALLIVEFNRLADTDEGAHLRGYLRGFIARLKGQPLGDSLHKTLGPAMVFMYVTGAGWGMLLGAHVIVSQHGRPEVNLRYVGAVFGAIIGGLFLPKPIFMLSADFMKALCVVATGAVCWILIKDDWKMGLLTIAILLFQIVLYRHHLRRKMHTFGKEMRSQPKEKH